MGYTMDPDPENTAKAYGKELQISPKASVEICNMLRGMDVESALDILDDVIEKKRAVPFRKHNKRVAHNKGVGPGRYPVKAAENIKRIIEEAQSNAEFKELDADNMKIIGLSASRGEVIQGFRPRAHGRTTPFDTKTTNLEVILQEKEE